MSINFRRNYLLVVLLVLLVSVLTFALGDMRVIAYTKSSNTADDEETANGIDYINDISLFDDTLVHEIQVLIDQEDYDSMIATYQETGLKEYFKADVIIDGVQVDDVGIRLKGNASLRTALGGEMGFGGRDRPDNFQAPADGEMPQMPEFAQGERPEPPDGFQMPEAGQGPGMNRGGQQISEDQIKIPFMIKFDEYVDGQTYQGHTTIAIRNYGTSYDEALLQEPITNLAARLSHVPATETSYAGFRFNDGEEKLYVVSELVNEGYLEKYFENDHGVLYKAEFGSTLTYQGEDPSSYADNFTQQTRVNDADLLPLIEFMRFLDQAEDAAFENELPDYLDVDAFASYLAINSMLVNTDSMLGMNNNYYLYYDDETEKITILMWDANESFGKLGGSATYDLSLTNPQQGGPGGGRGGGQNALLSRFMANEKFKALYEEKLQEVYEAAFASGAMTEKIDEVSALIHAANEDRNLVEIEAYDAAVENMKTFIGQREEYLEATGLFKE
ncbi:MAG: CotH kinase family protein [Chloroflexi bacterium]|nr:CotH kinase family protein [Chloroflexota bacterium]